MNKIGLHTNVLVAGWSNEEADYAIKKTAELGYDLIELPGIIFHTFDVPHTRALLDKHELASAMSLGLSEETDISSGDPDRIAAGEELLTRVLNTASELGVSTVCGILHSAFQKYSVAPTEKGISGAVDALRRIGETASKLDIEIGLEVVNRYETNVLNTAAQAGDMRERIDIPNVKVHLDTYHMNIEEADPAQAIRDTGERLGYFHIGESHRGYMGAGTIDFPRVFRALAGIGYPGAITFESFSSKVVGDQIAGILAVWRNLWDDGEDLARHARQFALAELKAAHEATSRKNVLITGS